MGSTRYPGKMSKKLGEYPLIDWVIQSKESKLLMKLYWLLLLQEKIIFLSTELS